MGPVTGGEEKNAAPAVLRAAAVLSHLAERPGRRVPLSELSRQLGISRSTLLYVCRALLASRLITRTESGYQLGRRCVELGSAYLASVDLVREFHDACVSLPGDFDGTVQLGVLDGGLNVVYLARQEGTAPLRLGLQAEIGRAVPANCAGAGKALLAALDERELALRLADAEPLPRLTPSSMGTLPELTSALARVHEQGYATDDEEVIPGIMCVATAGETPQRSDGLFAVSITFSKLKASDVAIADYVDITGRLVAALERSL